MTEIMKIKEDLEITDENKEEFVEFLNKCLKVLDKMENIFISFQ